MVSFNEDTYIQWCSSLFKDLNYELSNMNNRLPHKNYYLTINNKLKNFFFSDEIKIDSPDQPGKAQIISFSVWGILRGMESFGHLIYYSTFEGTNKPTVISNR